jgi:hypothetical protein
MRKKRVNSDSAERWYKNTMAMLRSEPEIHESIQCLWNSGSIYVQYRGYDYTITKSHRALELKVKFDGRVVAAKHNEIRGIVVWSCRPPDDALFLTKMRLYL